MNTLFWLTILVNGIGGLYGVATGLNQLLSRQRMLGNVLVPYSLSGACVVLLSGTYKLHLLGFQQTALWITLTLWLMMLVSVSAFLLVNLGERETATTLPSIPSPIKSSPLPLENVAVCA